MPHEAHAAGARSAPWSESNLPASRADGLLATGSGSPPIVLAFSGGLDTSWCVPWLRETHGCEVVTVTVDSGGLGPQASEQLAALSHALGAARHIHIDARAAFYDDVVRFLLIGHVRRGGLYPLCVGAERTLQAREVARTARALGATAVAHGCTAAGNDQVRFEIALRVLAPELAVLAPIRDVGPSRADEVAFLEARGLPVPAHGARYSINSGLLGVTIGGVETTGTTRGLPEEAWVRTRGAFESALPPARHMVRYERGQPVALDDEPLAPVALIERVDELAARHGIGRGIHLGDTILGSKGRVAFEAPAAEVLMLAHRELEKLVLTATQQRVKDLVAPIYGDLVHEGRHLEPAARDLEQLFLSTQARVTGTVELTLRTGSAFVEGVSSPHSLHAACRSVYGEAARDWTSADARGFSQLLALPLVLHARAAGGGA